MRRAMIFFLVFAMLASALLGTAGAVHAATVAFVPISPIIIEPIPIVPIDPALLNQRSLYAVPLYRMRIFKPLGSMNLEYFRYTTSESERTYLKSVDYSDAGIVGYVSKAWFPGMYPISRWNCSGRPDFLTLTSNNYSPTYYKSGVLGYAMPPVSGTAPSGTLNIFRYQRPLLSGYGQVSTSFLYVPAYPSPNPAYVNGTPQMRFWASPILLQKITVAPFASNLTGSSVVEIKWSATRSSGFVDLLYSKDGGVNYTTIVSKIANSTGKYNWTVPNITADDCHIMVRWTADPTLASMAWSVGTQFKIARNFVFAPTLDFSLMPLLEFPPAPPTALAAVAGDATPLIRLTWEDNSPNEEGFLIQRKAEGGIWADLAPVSANAVGYDDITIAMDMLYNYRVKALGPGDVADSAYSEEAQAIFNDPATPPEELVPETPSAVAAPTNLVGTQMPGANRPVKLTWDASSSTVLGYSIERMITDTWQEIATLMDPAVLTHTDTGLADPAITSASYRVTAIGEVENSLPSAVAMVILTVPTVPAAPSFDGTQSGWAEGEITLAFQNGLTYPGVMYEFGRKITREEFCTIAVKLYEKLTGYTAAPGADPFDDTDNPDILKAYALGIVRGISANLFAPGNNITRQEICVMIYRALQAAGESTIITPGGTFPFTDASDIASWAINEVRFCHQREIMRGMSATTIAPLGNTTREQAIALLYRTFDAFK